MRPWTIIDYDDWLELRYLDLDVKIARLRDLLADRLVNRPAEFAAFKRAYLQSERRLSGNARELTRRQEQALRARSEAMRLGRKDIQAYVARCLGVSQPAASMLLTRADARLEAKMLYSGELFQIMTEPEYLPQNQQLIKAWMVTHARECAGYGRPEERRGKHVIPACKGETRNNHALCWDCRQVYGFEWPDWLHFRVRDIEREYRQAAVDALMRAGKLATEVALEGEYIEDAA